MRDPIVAFYEATSPDDEGRSLAEIWLWGFDRLEEVHDFIQWLFPLDTVSSANRSAPLVSDETRAAFRASPELRQRLRRSLEVMLLFYGLVCRDGANGPEVTKGPNYDERRGNWLSGSRMFTNHNHLRITRILRSLVLLGLPEYATACYLFLRSIERNEQTNVSAITLAHWKRAATPERR